MSEGVRFENYELLRREDGSMFELGRGMGSYPHYRAGMGRAQRAAGAGRGAPSKDAAPMQFRGNAHAVGGAAPYCARNEGVPPIDKLR